MFKPFLREFAILILCSISIRALSADLREKVIIIDTGLPTDRTAFQKYMCEEPSLDFTGRGITDVVGHGTNIIGLIYPYMDPNTQCLMIIKYFHNDDEYKYKQHKDSSYVYYIMSAVGLTLSKLKPKFVNMSYNGDGMYSKELKGILDVLNNKGYVSVAAGNDGLDLSKECIKYPACYSIKNDRFFVVGTPASFSNYGGPVNVIQSGVHQCALGFCLSGTSQATAINTGELIYKHNKELSNGKKRTKSVPKRIKSHCKGTEGSCRRSNS